MSRVGREENRKKKKPQNASGHRFNRLLEMAVVKTFHQAKKKKREKENDETVKLNLYCRTIKTLTKPKKKKNLEKKRPMKSQSPTIIIDQAYL